MNDCQIPWAVLTRRPLPWWMQRHEYLPDLARDLEHNWQRDEVEGNVDDRLGHIWILSLHRTLPTLYAERKLHDLGHLRQPYLKSAFQICN